VAAHRIPFAVPQEADLVSAPEPPVDEERVLLEAIRQREKEIRVRVELLDLKIGVGTNLSF